MKHKTKEFIKNCTITSLACVATGVGASEFSDYFTDNGKIIGVASTVTQYLTSAGVFLPLHARSNKDLLMRRVNLN